jgi:hypothetical protein
MSALQLLPGGPDGPFVLWGPANRCEAARCQAPAYLAVSNPSTGSSRRVCLDHAGAALLVEASDGSDPARLTVTRLG